LIESEQNNSKMELQLQRAQMRKSICKNPDIPNIQPSYWPVSNPANQDEGLHFTANHRS
jgi:hypothetical protein